MSQMNQPLQRSDYRIRLLIGFLGIALPAALIIAKGRVLASISHYYYDDVASLIFIVILSAFGLFLISYKGYKIDPETEMLSDDFLTNIGGLAALLVVIIPTACDGSGSTLIDGFCGSGREPLLGHVNSTKSVIHLVAAGIFILTMGWMSSYKFTRGDDDGFHGVYRWCGYLVFISVGLILIGKLLVTLEVPFFIEDYYVFIFETTAIIPFGISWLIKGKMVEEMQAMRVKMFGE